MNSETNTSGGASVEGDVRTDGGDFIGRDSTNLKGDKNTVFRVEAGNVTINSGFSENQLLHNEAQALPQPTKRIKILFIAASPDNIPPLSLGREIRALKEGLRQARYGHLFDIVQEWSARLEDLQASLLREKPDILHIAGHGMQQGNIILENDDGQADIIPNETLTRLLLIFKQDIKVVFLNTEYYARAGCLKTMY